MPTDLERFWSKVDKTGECWEWRGYVQKPPRRDYGHFSVKRQAVRAHRWIYEQINGLLPAGIDVCHSCDNNRCVRPDHLFAGTRSDNMWDASRKGRVPGQQKTHCPRGHSLSGTNLMRDNRGHRKCRTCQRLHQWKYDAKRRGYDAALAGEGK